jgi:hypothetical protein
MSECRALVRVQIPDRPGALGLVASRIGALKGDIVGIEVLDRRDGSAIDEFAVVFASDEVLPGVHREISEVDGARVDAIEVVGEFPEPRLDALRAALAFSTAKDRQQIADLLVDTVLRTTQASWCALETTTVRAASAGAPPTVDTPTQRIGLGAAGGELHIHRSRDLSPGEYATAVAYCALVEEHWRRLPDD